MIVSPQFEQFSEEAAVVHRLSADGESPVFLLAHGGTQYCLQTETTLLYFTASTLDEAIDYADNWLASNPHA